MINSIVFFLGLCVFNFALWLISVLLVKCSGYEQAGAFSLAMSIGNTFFPMISFGMRQFQVSDINNAYSDNEYVLSRKITSIFSTVIFFVFVSIMHYSSELFFIIIGYYAFKLIEGYVDVYNGISQKHGDMWVSGVSLLIRGIAIIVIFFTSFLFYKNIVLLVFLLTLSELLCAIIFDNNMARKKSSFSIKFSRQELKSSFMLLASTSILMCCALFSMLTNTIPKILLEHSVNTTILGYFSSITAPTAIFPLFVSAIMVPTVSKLATHYHNRRSNMLYKYLIMLVFLITIVVILGMSFSMLFGEKLLCILFSKEILVYFNLLYYSLLSVLLSSIIGIFASFLTAFRKLKALLLFSLISVILVAILSIILIQQYMIYGAAYALIIAQLIQLIPETVYLLKVISSLKKETT